MTGLDRAAAALMLGVCLSLAWTVLRAQPAEPLPEKQLVVIEMNRTTREVSARRASEEEIAALQDAPLPDDTLRSAIRIDARDGQVDPLDAGLSWYWLAFGFGAQLLFTARMLVQWIASERAKASVVPSAFWILSAIGGLMLLAYFLRRGDPVGVTGQALGLTIYARNLIFIRRSAAKNRANDPRGPAVGQAEA